MSKGAYTIRIQNRFAELLSGAESDTEATKPKTTPAVVSTKPKVAVREERKPRAPRPDAATRSSRQAAAQREEVPRREPRPEKRVDEEDPISEGPKHVVRASVRPRVHEKSASQTRPNDRRSRTGRGQEMKKSGGGGHNWGNEEADFGGDVVRGESEQFNGETSPGETPAPEKPAEPVTIDFAAYEKLQKQKCQQLAQREVLAPLRRVDPSELEKEGFEKLEREENPDEKVARTYHVEEEVVEPGQRLKTYHLRDLPGLPKNRRSKGNRAVVTQPRQVVPVNLDLSDALAFPTLG